jgi:hypothetical protein
MEEFCGKENFATGIIDQGQPGRLAARIDLESQRPHLWLLDGHLEDQGERISPRHGCLARCQQQACISRMNGIERLVVLIDKKGVAHERASCFQGKVRLDKVSNGFLVL